MLGQGKSSGERVSMTIDERLATAARTRPTLPRFGPIAVVIVAVVGLEVAYGVGLGDALLYLGFEIAFAIVPGVLVYRALSSRPGTWLRQLAIGWTVGYS